MTNRNDHNHNVVQFSDLLREKLGAKLLARIDSGSDDKGNPVITGDLGPVEVSVYTSQEDGAIVVQIDGPTAAPDETHSLRVYLNDSTLYDSSMEATEDSDEQGD